MKIKCKTPRCGKEIEYEREVIPVDLLMLPVDAEEHTIVYLTCPDGHTNRYDVTEEQ